jgi:hypothetical protein
LATVCAAACSLACTDVIHLSTDATETLGGLTFRDGDVAAYDTATGTATLLCDESLFTANEQLDALYVRSNGNILLSSDSTARLGGLTFLDGDIVEYEPVTDMATMFFSESTFGANRDIDAFHLLGNGHLLLSVREAANIWNGWSFTHGDVVEYDPVTGAVSLYFSEALYAANEDIDAVHALSSGNLLLSTTDKATLGGLTFLDGDIVEYDFATTAWRAEHVQAGSGLFQCAAPLSK